ncbi:uncharacterized protein LOC113384763 [Ctenocephalides felis]|uniref:uncharacterized protein LOC113384763 n=1 Tax=Ctenocephalides felis TaxID=7515 RepID=UPI000E6E1DF2|nr:uncharacterized protein LOC113384763 [Ctenocephalides felis]
MHHQQSIGWALVTMIICSTITTTLGYPNPPQVARSLPQVARQDDDRKFAEKPNAMKKVALDDIDDIQTNQIHDGGFSWSNMLGMVMQMIFNGVGGGHSAPSKSDSLETDSIAPSPWANMLSVGLKILTAILGGGVSNDGIDKVDNGNSPMQGILAAVLGAVLGSKDPEQVSTMAKQAGEFINIVVNLLDALKTSFSHRSLQARSSGKKDSLSDAAVAGLSMFKGYMRSVGESARANEVETVEPCMQRRVCEASAECIAAIGGGSIFCQLGAYATSFALERSSGTTFEAFYEAGRRGRSGEDCRQLYLTCNEV